jgi:hypothetical protein
VPLLLLLLLLPLVLMLLVVVCNSRRYSCTRRTVSKKKQKKKRKKLTYGPRDRLRLLGLYTIRRPVLMVVYDRQGSRKSSLAVIKIS